MNQYIHHPADIPLAYKLGTATQPPSPSNPLPGLSFECEQALSPGTSIHIAIPLADAQFEADGIIAECHPESDHFYIAVQLQDQTSPFLLRMVEQACHIQHYKIDILKNEGRALSDEEAAAEWISQYASTFPR